MPLGRTFSFDDNDEQALGSNEQERLDYHQNNSHAFHSYHDSLPVRDIVSPPPQYSSPPPREPVSPISPTPVTRRPLHPSTHPDSAFHRSNAQGDPSLSLNAPPLPPPPPPHQEARYGIPHASYAEPYRINSVVTPGMDNFGQRAPGSGLDHLAYGIAERDPRESGVQALQATDYTGSSNRPLSPNRQFHPSDSPTPYRGQRTPSPNGYLQQRDSYSSHMPLAAGAATPGSMTPGAIPDPSSSGVSGRSIPREEYSTTQPGHGGYRDSPYQVSSFNFHPQVNEANINPYNIADDGDDGFIPDPKRRSVLNLGRQENSEAYPPASAAAASGGAVGAFSGLFGRKKNAQTPSGSYDPVRQGGNNGAQLDEPGRAEKSEWLSRQTKGNKKMGWIVGLVIGTVVVLAIIAGIVGGVLGSKSAKSSSSSSSNSDNNAGTDTTQNGDLDRNSPEIQALLNNVNLHKVFPGIDYTPWGTQYPLCLTYPPSQNNVTRDMAVLSQLTNAVRLYGTDCNQTQMVLHSISRLALTDMKVWLGVWIDTNQTTTDRQLAQMYTILENTSDTSIFKGAIIGNEALFRAGVDKATSEAELIQTLTDVKSNFTAKGYNIPVATSDLGDNWNAQLVAVSDMVMSNIHPFFAGVAADQAAAWTFNFWDTHDVPLTAGAAGNGKTQIISETGWPSGGGTDCGGATGDCSPGQSGAVASVDGMNQFMDDFVCQALENGTEYFWFEAFDEPWKIVYNSPQEGKNWETEWGIMDPARNLKSGLTIPSCGGKTVG